MKSKSKNNMFLKTISSCVKTRYEDMLPDIMETNKNNLSSTNDMESLIFKEFRVSEDFEKLSGGRVSNVYKINQEGQYKVIKSSTGLYRMAELEREAHVLRFLLNNGYGHIVPYINDFKMLDNFAYIVEEYIEGIIVREKLSENTSIEQRLKVWECVGQSLSQIHKLCQGNDINDKWINGQLEIARFNMENDLLDYEEFQEETPERMLSWLILNKPSENQISLIHGDFRTKNIIINNDIYYKIIDWGFVDIGSPFYDLAIIDYYFRDNLDRESFYKGYNKNKYNKEIIEYYDRLSKFINI